MGDDGQHLTEDQAAVYDRQLRVWGVEVQRRWAGVTPRSRGGWPRGVGGGLRWPWGHAAAAGQAGRRKVDINVRAMCVRHGACRLTAAQVLIVGADGLAAEVGGRQGSRGSVVHRSAQ